MTPRRTPLPDEASALFQGPPEGFVAARDALAARLRDEGRTDDASAVKRLRKPTVVAWALDQLATRDPDGVQELLEAGAEVRAAQQAALSSKRGAAERLRTAGIARAAAVTRLATVAAAVLREAGKAPDTHADAIARALGVSATDHDAAAMLAAGTFERPPAAGAGFGDVFGLTALEGGGAADEASTPEPASPRAAVAPTRPGPNSAELAELRHEVARLRRDRDAAARRARKAADAADGFAHELEGMRRRLEVIERKHADAAVEGGRRLARGQAGRARAAPGDRAPRVGRRRLSRTGMTPAGTEPRLRSARSRSARPARSRPRTCARTARRG